MTLQDANGYSLRAYHHGDEEQLLSLFNRVFEDFVGFTPRTHEYWRWAVLSRPGLGEDGIVVAVDAAAGIVGYAAVERSGNILEFCYDPDCNGKTIISMLLRWCTDYGEAQGASAISLNAPVQDDFIRQVTEEFGFTEEPFAPLFLRLLDLPYFLRKVQEEENKKVGRYNEAVLVSLRKFPRWCADHVSILVRDGTVSVSTERTEKPTIRIDADVSTISSCLFGSSGTLYRAILKRQLKIRPFQKIPRAVKILSLFQLKNPKWYVPGTDYG